MNILSVFTTLLFWGSFGTEEFLLILLIVLLLFGSTRIPALMRSLGRGVGSFKKGLKEDVDIDEVKKEKDDAQE